MNTKGPTSNRMTLPSVAVLKVVPPSGYGAGVSFFISSPESAELADIDDDVIAHRRRYQELVYLRRLVQETTVGPDDHIGTEMGCACLPVPT